MTDPILCERRNSTSTTRKIYLIKIKSINGWIYIYIDGHVLDQNMTNFNPLSFRDLFIFKMDIHIYPLKPT